MIRGFRVALAAALCLFALSCSDDDATSSAASTTPTPPDRTSPTQVTPVTASVVAAPIPVPATDGKVHMAYELALSNSAPSAVVVKSITATAGGATLQTIAGDDVEIWMKVRGTSTRSNVIGPGQGAIVVVDAVVGSLADVPDWIEHTIDIDVETPMPPLVPPSISETQVAPTHVDRAEVVRIAPPLDGKHWLDADSCCVPGAHRSALNPLNGQLYAPERFAIDYVQLRDDGTLYSGDLADVNSFAYYGSEIHAVADGKVVAVVTDQPQQVPGVLPSGLALEQYGGNHVVQDIGGGHYAFYAHMQGGDGVKVKVGDELTVGDTIGLLGNSGNTDAPHLHFHVMDGPDPLAANGLPFEIESFDLEARIADNAVVDELFDGDKARYADGVDAGPRTDVSPLSHDVMGYTLGN